MGPSVKYFLGVLEWSYVIPEKTFFSSKIEFGSGCPPPPLAKHQTFYVIYFVKPSLIWIWNYR